MKRLTNLSLINFLLSAVEYLQPRTKYVFYVRAWYDEAHVAEYISEGILIDGTSPEISRSTYVKELSRWSANKDIDFTTETSYVIATWNGVFRDAQTGILRFVVKLGSRWGSSDIVVKEFSGATDKVNITNLSLEAGKQYYTTVEAFNQAGLHSVSHSDGFMVSQPHICRFNCSICSDCKSFK